MFLHNLAWVVFAIFLEAVVDYFMDAFDIHPRKRSRDNRHN